MTDRAPDALRTLTIEPDWAPHAEGSCLIAMGDTRVLCTASVEDSLPPWREASGKGWVTAEYGMLPRSTHSRRRRERKGAGGRTREIERLIGRSLRAVVDFERLGPRSIIVDCDVLQADGGTRTASITGGFLALAIACHRLVASGALEASPIREAVAAISVGIVDGVPRLDLDYALDSTAQVDMNVVATESGGLVEVQGTAEGAPFTREEHEQLLDLAFHGIEQCIGVQRQLLDFLTGLS